MSIRAHLQVHDLTARLRGRDPRRPVLVGVDGTRVVLVANPAAADVIARLIARGAAHPEPGDTFDQVQVDHAVVDLLAAAAEAGGHHADPVGYTLAAVVQ